MQVFPNQGSKRRYLCDDAGVHALPQLALGLLHQVSNEQHHGGGAIPAGGKQQHIPFEQQLDSGT